MQNQIHKPQAGNGARKSRRRRVANPHAPGQPFGEAVKELMGLAGVARLLVSGLDGAATEIDCKETAEHLAHRLDALATVLADLEYIDRIDPQGKDAQGGAS